MTNNDLTRKLVLGLSLFVGLQLTNSLARGADEEIKTVRFRLVGQLANDPPLVQRWYMTTDAMRMELPGGQAAGVRESSLPLMAAVIESLRLKQGLAIDFLEKQAVRMQLDDAQIRQCHNPAAAMSRIVTDPGEVLREEKVAERKTQVYRLKKLDFLFLTQPVGEKDSAMLWVDLETELPVRIELKIANLDGQGESKMVFDEFTWNEPIDAKLFELKAPDGFAVTGDSGTKMR